MKGIVLAGGLGTRLLPLTKVTNKHLLPIYNQPMVYYPIQTLAAAGIKSVMVVTGGNNADDFKKLLGNGEDFGLEEISYAYQTGEGGIAAALSLAKDFVGSDKVVIILGDNLIEKDIKKFVRSFETQPKGAKIILKEVPDPERFGVPEIKDGKIVNIEEKPKKPKSNYAVTGIYMYDHHVFDIIKTLKPSGRGELEITDVNNAYLKEKTLTHETMEGWWTDAGTSFEALFRASKLIAEKNKRK
ncbi:MAG: NTP transferase domain-containing protein [Planctomycetes bacterium]|nr:NTP transferase domain-containing protein [Planctomycetota bacterium]